MEKDDALFTVKVSISAQHASEQEFYSHLFKCKQLASQFDKQCYHLY